MNDDQSTQTSINETAAGLASEAQQNGDEDVEVIKERVDGKIEGVKQHFGQIVDRRDRKIMELEAGRAKRRVLVIDDGKSTVDILNGYLKGQPVEIIGCSGRRARDSLASGNYDAIMIDESVVIEQGVKGLDLCQELCGFGKVKTVIVMSSHPGDKIRKVAEQTGAAFVKKPFKGLELMQVMSKIFVGEKK